MFCIACEFLKGLGKTVMDGHFSQTDLAGNLNCVTISVTSFKRLNLSASRGYVCDHTQVTELLGRSKERTSVRCLAWCLLVPLAGWWALLPTLSLTSHSHDGMEVFQEDPTNPPSFALSRIPQTESQKAPGRHLQLPSHLFKNRDHTCLHQPESQLY